MNPLSIQQQQIYQGATLDIQILGGISMLCQVSSLHRNYSIGLFNLIFRPPLNTKQYLYYQDESGNPLAYCNWAFVNDDILYALKHHKYKLKPNDWRSGPHLWIPELLAPFGHCRMVVKDLKRLFPGRVSSALRVKQREGLSPVYRTAKYHAKFI